MQKKTISTIVAALLVGGGIGAGSMSFGAAPDESKQAILQENIYLHVRLGEPPLWDASIVTADEMSQAYISLADEKDAKQTEDLYANLRAEASGKGLLCE